MEKLMVKAYDMECMKMALLKHEETFKQQVYELHRLYEIQRMLMKKMQISVQNTSSWSLENGNIYDEKQHQDDDDLQKQVHGDHEDDDDEDDDDDDDDDDDGMEDESEIELTLGPTTRYSRKKKKKKGRSLYLESSGLGMFSSPSSSSSTHKTRLITLQNSGILDCSRSTACS